ncbi:MAG: pseudouridine synthase, partial [Lepagella sp.]
MEGDPENSGYQQRGFGYQPRQQGGYQQRPYQQRQGAYQPRPYQPRPQSAYSSNQDGDMANEQKPMQGGYQPRQQGGYQP